MTKTETLSKAAKLQKRREQIDAQLRALNAREKEASRKVDTRRKVIAGALALEHMEKNKGSEFAKVLHGLLHEYVERPGDRALFDLKGDAPKKSTSPDVLKTAAE